MAKYLVHKAVDLVKVKVKRRAVLSQPGYLESNYWVLKKYDGCCGIIYVDDEGRATQILTRTGEKIRSCDHILDWITTDGHWRNVVLFVELWHPDMDFSEISGKVRQHKPAPELIYKAWDVVPLLDYYDGECSIPFRERYGWMQANVPSDFLAYLYPYNPMSLVDEANAVRASGPYDGLIAKDPNGTWKLGLGTDGESVKIKPPLSFDLEVVGTTEGEGKHAGRIGSLLVRFVSGNVLGIGTGLSDRDRLRDDWVGKIVEVEAMGYSSEGSLREPRLKGERFDKEQADF